MIIGITGPSGVGKTTVSKMLAVILGHRETIVLSGDDLHKWERENHNWQMYTHLNPKANDLSQGAKDIGLLKTGHHIHRRVYNHDTGHFTELMKISPHKHIIHEGLHTLYDKDTRGLCDFSIYVETDIELKKEWKLKRDTKNRGYTIEQVLDAMKKRIPDEQKYITPQKKHADAIIEFNKNNGNVELSYTCEDTSYHPLLDELVALYNKYREFLEISARVYSRKTLAPNRGGNMSFRWNDVLSITSSGVDFGEIELFSGYTRCDVHTLENVFTTEAPPSMEASTHVKMGKNVLHTHPANVLAILCCQEASQILGTLFEEKYTILDYYSPGDELSSAIINSGTVVFARNHGLFVSSKNSLKECYEITCRIEDRCKQFFKEIINKNYLFPDAYVLEEENDMLHSFVKNKINEAGLTPAPLPSARILELENMEAEKYRKQK